MGCGWAGTLDERIGYGEKRARDREQQGEAIQLQREDQRHDAEHGEQQQRFLRGYSARRERSVLGACDVRIS